jgi:hypothetical protein
MMRVIRFTRAQQLMLAYWRPQATKSSFDAIPPRKQKEQTVILKRSICVLYALSFLGASTCVGLARDEDRGLKMLPALSDMQTCRQQTPQEAAKSKAVKRLIRYYR